MKFLRPIFIVFLLSIFFGGNGFSQAVSRFSYEKYIEGTDTLLYRQLFPDNVQMKKYPLVIFLHGAGERGNDNEAQLKWGVNNFATDGEMKLHPAIVVAPQCPANDRWSNFSNTNQGKMTIQPEAAKPMQLLMNLIQKLKQTMPVDTTRIYITGLSMGGFGTFDVITRLPGLFAAAVPVCGGGDESKAAVIAKIPLWIFHGAQDPTVNPEYSINMAEALRKEGAHPGLTLYPETGHFSWIPAYSDPMMIEWMFSQRK